MTRTAPPLTASQQLFAELQPGDRVQVDHEIKVGLKVWQCTTVGTVERAERRRHSLHFNRNFDDKVFSDSLVLRRDDGELTTITVDEYTQLKRV